MQQKLIADLADLVKNETSNAINEYAYIFNANYDLVEIIEGNEHQVVIPKEQLRGNKLIIHNHPNSISAILSPNDINTADQFGVDIIAVTEHAFTIYHPKSKIQYHFFFFD